MKPKEAVFRLLETTWGPVAVMLFVTTLAILGLLYFVR